MADFLERIYDQHAHALFAFVLNLTRHEADTQDILQEIFRKLGRRPDCLKDVANERAFLLRMAYRIVIDQSRRRAVRDRAAEALPAPLFAPSDDPDAAAHRATLEAALAELPPDQRAVVHLRLWSGLTFAEIAQTLDLPPDTAASRYRYGLDKLRTLLRPYYEAL